MSKVVYIDVETTGLDPDTCQVLEVACLVDDLSQEFNPSKWSCYVRHPLIRGEVDALAMHSSWIRETKNGIDPSIVSNRMCDFLSNHFREGDLVIGGKNVAFDVRFLATLPGFTLEGSRLRIKYTYTCSSRYVDPGMLFWNKGPRPGIPSLAEIAALCGIEYTAHRAMDDCMVAALAVREGLNARS